MNAELAELAVLLEELSNRQKHKAKTYVPDDHPERNQLAFHRSQTRYRLIFGGNRSGKSRSSAQEIYWWATGTHPYITVPKVSRIWVLSAEYRTIFEGIWSHLKNILPAWEIERIGAQIAGHNLPSFIEFKTGSRIDFISAQGGGDDTRKKMQAAEIDLLVIDEEISGNLWLELRMRLLTRGGRMILSATLVESEEWIIDLEDQFNAGATNISIFRLNTIYNSYNDKELLNELLDGMSEEEKSVRILGNRRRTSGLIYGNWLERPSDSRTSNLIDPFNIPPDWTRIMCIDPGFRVFAGLWVAISPLNLSVAYREMYLKNAELADVVHFIRTVEDQENERGAKERIKWRVIDSASFNHHEDGSVGVGYTLNDDYAFDFCPAPTKDKRTNIEDVRKWLMPSGQKDVSGLEIPGFRIFRTLENFQSERRKYRVPEDSNNPMSNSRSDLPVSRADHLMNCWEYLASSKFGFIAPLTPSEEMEKFARTPNSKISFPENRMFKIQLQKERMRQRHAHLRSRDR